MIGFGIRRHLQEFHQLLFRAGVGYGGQRLVEQFDFPVMFAQ